MEIVLKSTCKALELIDKVETQDQFMGFSGDIGMLLTQHSNKIMKAKEQIN